MSSPALPAYPRLPAWWLVLLILATFILALVLGIWLGPRLGEVADRLLPESQAHAERGATSGPTVWYQSQMHPWVIQPYPGLCPICGMDLTPVDPARFGAEVTVSPITVQNIGISAQPARRGGLSRTVRSVGVVEFDPGRLHDINLRSAAWIENLQVAAAGDRVRAGDHLFDLVSQELYAAQVEYLQVRHDPRLIESVRRRLAWLGMPDLSALEAAGQPLERVPVHSPINGVVMSREAVEGMRMSAGSSVLTLANDEQLWLRVTLFEHQLSELEPGMSAQVRLRDGREIKGHLAYIEPTLDTRTRSLSARIILDNSDGLLRPGAFAQVRIPLSSQEALLVPRSAVVSTGERDVLFLSLGRGRFAPRQVQLGIEDDLGMVAITEGLAEGEQVVVSGQFLIDAESRMIEAIARQIFPDRDLAQDRAPSSPAPRPSSEGPYTPLLTAYAALSERLYADDAQAAMEAVPALGQAAEAIDGLSSEISDALGELASATDLKSLRWAFGALGIALRDTFEAQPRAEAAGWTAFHCGMAPAPDDGWWLQEEDEEARNPFFGARHGMRACHVDARVMPAPAAADGPGEAAQQGPWPAFLQGYEALSAALYADDAAAAQGAAAELTAPVTALEAAVAALQAATELAGLRVAFGDLGVALRDLAAEALPPALASWTVLYCGMAPGAAEDGVWLQADDAEARNPFFGARHGMRACHVNAHAAGARP
ncbi:MAG: efflux RND transporter periplasmic adaptor subunit [Planctomycetota bacterium]|nr:MAG: efflux RND transporter periplasmic adaptor subunit [Planctomycetota bacterium]